MIFLLIGLILLVFYKADINGEKIYSDYMSKEQTVSIRGIFACIIFFSHLRDYVTFSGELDELYIWILAHIGQCMVAVFFFYSGYGILLSYRFKDNYENSFLKKRIILTWVHFATAVICYCGLNLLLDIEYPIYTVMLSFSGWKNVGNSNWFMFDTLVLYIIVWMSFKIIRLIYTKFPKVIEYKSEFLTLLIGFFSICFILVLHIYKESWWYDTILCFFAGCIYGICKEKVDRLFQNSKLYLFAGIVYAMLFMFFYRRGNAITYNICAITFVLLISWFTMKIKIVNPILMWLGEHSFYIYIYMRIPMIVLKKLNAFPNYNYLFAVTALMMTILLSYVMKKLQIKIDQYLLYKK